MRSYKAYISFICLLLSLVFALGACRTPGKDTVTDTDGTGAEDTAKGGDPAVVTSYEQGIWAEYYKDTSFTKYVRSAKEDNIDFEWKTGSAPGDKMPAENYSIRYSGMIKPDKSGKYTIITEADDGVVVTLDGREIINDAGPHTKARSTAEVTLEADRYYDLNVEYYNGALGGSISLRWSAEGIAECPVPAENLFLPKYPAAVSISFTGTDVSVGAKIQRQEKEGYVLVIEKILPDGSPADTVTVPCDGKTRWNYTYKTETEADRMSTYKAFVTNGDKAVASNEVSRKYGEDYSITVDPANKTGDVSGLLVGSCMEDVNHELYGGIWSQMIFGESFEEAPAPSGDSPFTPAGGSWYAKENGSVLAIDNTANGPKLVINDTSCTEGFIEADVKFSGDGAGFIIKVSDASEGADNFYGYEISLFNGKVRLGDHRNNYNGISDTPCSAVKPNTWIKLTVEFTENKIGLYVNGEDVVFYTDPNPLKKGAIGFRSWNASAEYKNIQVGADTKVKKVDISALDSGNGVSSMWKSEIKNAEGGANVTTSDVFTGKQSQMIEMTSGTGSVSINNMGLNRSGMAFLKDKDYNGYIYAKSDSPVTVYVALENADGSVRYAESSVTVSGDWSKYPFTLVSNGDETKGRFVIELRSAGKINVGYAFLEAGEWGLYKGLHVRRDVGEMLEKQGITVLRFGGCMANASDYKWKRMTGAPEFRGSYNGWWYAKSSYGFGIFEFLELCEKLGVVAVPDFNSYESAADMGDFITFATGTDINNEWVRLRTEMGHPEPFRLEYIEIGNEEKVDSGYASRFNAVANKIWSLDKTVTLVVGDFEYKEAISDPDRLTGATSGISDMRAHKSILENAVRKGREVLFDVHFWSESGNDPFNVMNVSLSFYGALKKLCPEAKTGLCVFELNANSHHFERALANAFAISFAERHSDVIRIMCSANALQVQDQNDNGWNQGLVFMNNNSVWYQAPAYIDRMYLDAYQPCVPDVESEDEVHTAKFDVTVTSSVDGKSVCVKILNRSGKDQGVGVNIPAFAGKNVKITKVIYADDMRAVNTAKKPGNTKPNAPETSSSALENGNLLITSAGYSVTVVTVTLG